MSIYQLIFGISLGLLFSSALAHDEHHYHELSESEIEQIALDAAYQFASSDSGLGFGKLESSWKSVTKEMAKINAWVDDFVIASVTNESEKEKLYLLVSSNSGEVLTAFTDKASIGMVVSEQSLEGYNKPILKIEMPETDESEHSHDDGTSHTH